MTYINTAVKIRIHEDSIFHGFGGYIPHQKLASIANDKAQSLFITCK